MATCSHGDMVYRSGEKNGKAWAAYFCSAPKGSPDQCQPQWQRNNGGDSAPSSGTMLDELKKQTMILESIRQSLHPKENVTSSEAPF